MANTQGNVAELRGAGADARARFSDKIDRIEAVPLVVVGEGPKGPFVRNAILTRVGLSGGIVGECLLALGGGVQSPDVAKLIVGEAADLVIGMDPFAVEKVWEALKPMTYNLFRDRRLGLRAQGCIDAALWDAVGKALGVPLYKLWGGYTNELIPMELGAFWSPEKTYADYGRYIESLVERGVGGCKFKVGRLLTPEQDAERIAVAREAGGADFYLTADANGCYTVEEAVRFARGIRGLDIKWIEEPCPWYNDRHDSVAVRYRGGEPVGAGQSEVTVQGCRDLMAAGAIDVCNFDAAWGGGPTAWLRVAAIASSYNIRVTQHQEPQIGAHLAASMANTCGVIEIYSEEQDPLWRDFFLNRPQYRNGRYQLTNEPGWGLVIDQDMVERAKA